MAGERVGGRSPLAGAGIVAGTQVSSGGGRAKPPEPQPNPVVLDTAGTYLVGIPKGTTLATIEQWGGAAAGGQASGANGGGGGGSAAYAKYTFAGVTIPKGGKFTVQVGFGGTAGGAGQTTIVLNGGNNAKVTSGRGEQPAGAVGGAGGVNLVTPGSGLTVITNTAGSAGASGSGSTGGNGADAPGSGGTGGTGGTVGQFGTAATSPGAGGGGNGGSVSGNAGNGGVGKVIITFTIA
jgi:hypothetical protein